MQLIDRFSAVIRNSNYDTDIRMKVKVPLSSLEQFKNELLDVCRGNVVFITNED